MYKYKINELLASLTREQKREALREIKELLGISLSRLNLIRSAKFGQPVNISVEQLRKLADYFSIEMEEMLNYQPAEN
jgi:transcriptional regulator with XRE-family HTH domain